jgi:type I restriction enzyme M protein
LADPKLLESNGDGEPLKQFDHVVANIPFSDKRWSTGRRGTGILPHGVQFRGNAEAEIRKNLIQRGLIKGIIGLPANLF